MPPSVSLCTRIVIPDLPWGIPFVRQTSNFNLFPLEFKDVFHLFAQVLAQDFKDWSWAHVNLFQHVVELFCGASQDRLFEGTESLLKSLAIRGYKVSFKKAQTCQSWVTFLWMILKQERLAWVLTRLRLLWATPPSPPQRVLQSRAFLEVVVFCRIWIPEFSDLTRTLYHLLSETSTYPSPLNMGI